MLFLYIENNKYKSHKKSWMQNNALLIILCTTEGKFSKHAIYQTCVKIPICENNFFDPNFISYQQLGGQTRESGVTIKHLSDHVLI